MKLTMIVQVDDSVDPTLVDPHEIAEDVVAIYDEHARRNGDTRVEFVSAEWAS